MKNILSQDQLAHIHDYCNKFRIKNYTINSDGSIDVDGNVSLLTKWGNEEIPPGIKFNKVTGNFKCDRKKMTSFEACPVYVGGLFSCANNYLTSLVGCPQHVSILDCRGNKLTTLEGSPKRIEGDFNCGWNKLTSLEGCPEYVGGRIICVNNNISTLKYVPKFMGIGIRFAKNPPLDQLYHLIVKEVGDEGSYIFTKYAKDYDVWTPELNMSNVHELIEEIKDGLR